MSDHKALRIHALAAATAIVLTTSFVVASAGAVDRVNLGGLAASEQHDRFIVKFRSGSEELSSIAKLNASLGTAARSVAASGGRTLGLIHLRRMALGADVVKADRKLSRIEAEALMQRIAADPNVEYVEVDKLNRAVFTPNDTNFSQQYGFGTGAGGIRATEAWDITSGAGSVVAVLDTGITNHSDLNANILPGYDFIIDTAVSVDGNGRDSDPSDPGDGWTNSACGPFPAPPSQNSSWHGTHVAGTVAAVTNNAKGVAGTAFSAKVVPVRVLGRCGGYDSDIADAIIWASGGTVSGVPANANPAEAINLSLGGSGACGATTQSAINSAVSRGTTLVIAAGNDNSNVSNASPANCNNVVAVASTTNTGARSSFSNYGALIDVAGPGSSITSTLNAGAMAPGAESYASYSGTSMATPHVAGVVALIQSVAPTPLTPAQVETLLKNTARAFPSTPSQPIGTGIVNAKAAVDAAGGGTPGNNPPVANFTSSASGLTVQFTDTSTDNDGTIASRSWTFGDGTTSTAASPSKTYAAAGTYTVTLTVTDDDGATNTRTASVTVTTGGGGSVLSKGVPVTGLSAAAGASLNYTMVVPAGATNLTFTTSGGTGDADLYVKFGSAPTDTTFDCRPYASGNSENCTFASPQAGTYYVRVKGYSAFSGLSLVGDYATGGGGGVQTYSNGTDVNIPDNNATGVTSTIAVSGRSGNGQASTPVTVAIVHPYIGDLIVDLVAPDGSVYNLHNRTGGSADNINKTVNVNLSGEALNGAWSLRARDVASTDVGRIDSWSITF